MSSAVVPFYNRTEERWLSRPFPGIAREAFWADRPAHIGMAEWAFDQSNRYSLCRAARYVFDTIRRMTANNPDTWFSLNWMRRKLDECHAAASGGEPGEYVEPIPKTTWQDRAGWSMKWVHVIIRRLEAVGLIEVHHTQYENRYRLASGLLKAATAAPKNPATPGVGRKPKPGIATLAPRKDSATAKIDPDRLFPRLRPLWEKLSAARVTLAERFAASKQTQTDDIEDALLQAHDDLTAIQHEFLREFRLHYPPTVEFADPDG